MDARRILERYESSPAVERANQMDIPVTAFPMTPKGAEEFNQIYRLLLSMNLPKIQRGPSGGIRTARSVNRGECWDVRRISSCVEITALLDEGFFRFQFRSEGDQKGFKIYGRTAFVEFSRRLLADGVDITLYQIDNGPEVKSTISPGVKRMCRPGYADVIWTCPVYHVDFHSSFPAGLAKTHPEFSKTIERIYAERNDPGKKDMNKAILNLSIGYMQSIGCCKARWAHLSKDAIHDNNARVFDMHDRLIRNQYTPILINVDGIWYADELGRGPYHGEGEGYELGMWSTDHATTQFRAKSAAAYEYVEDGRYRAVMSGRSNLDRVKDRSEWEWGDIYRKLARPIEFSFVEGEGVVEVVEK